MVGDSESNKTTFVPVNHTSAEAARIIPDIPRPTSEPDRREQYLGYRAKHTYCDKFVGFFLGKVKLLVSEAAV